MLEKIITLENELAAKVEAVKHDAAHQIQETRTVANDARVALEQNLHSREITEIRDAEKVAQTEAATLIASAETASSTPISKEAIVRIAKEILVPYLRKK